jgi:hypothetical protein
MAASGAAIHARNDARAAAEFMTFLGFRKFHEIPNTK